MYFIAHCQQVIFNKHSEDHHRHNTVIFITSQILNQQKRVHNHGKQWRFIGHDFIMDIMTDPHPDEDLHGFANCRWLHELRWLTFAVSFTGNIYESTRFCCAAPFWKVGSPRAIFSPRHLLGNPLPDIIWKCIIPCRQICKFSKSLPFLGISCPSLFRIRRKKVGMLGRCWASLPWSPPLQLLPNNSMLPSTSGSAPGNQVFFQVVKFQALRWDFKRPTKKIQRWWRSRLSNCNRYE